MGAVVKAFLRLVKAKSSLPPGCYGKEKSFVSECVSEVSGAIIFEYPLMKRL